MSSRDVLLTLDTVLCWARSGHESDKVYRFIFLHPEDLFTIPKGRTSDGKTYERAAIKQYLLDNRFSPETGEQMNDEFIDDITTRDLISKFRQQKLLS
ncbi:unnamed protein product [Rotaria sp. Silwood2]|nr:unnamed protein product [Rotaria sp. Silwood2]